MNRVDKVDQYKSQVDAWRTILHSVLTLPRFGSVEGLYLGQPSGRINLIEHCGSIFTQRLVKEDSSAMDSDFGSRNWLGVVGFHPTGTVDRCRPVYLTSCGHEFIRAHRAREGYDGPDTTYGTLTGHEFSEVIARVFGAERAAQANDTPGGMDALYNSLFVGKIKYSEGVQPVENDPYDISHLFEDEYEDGEGGWMSFAERRTYVAEGAPLLHKGLSAGERFHRGDGAKYFPGRLVNWVALFIAEPLCNTKLQTQVDSFITQIVIEACSGIATDTKPCTWTESLSSILARMSDPTKQAYLPCRIRAKAPIRTGKVTRDGVESNLMYTDHKCEGLYIRSDTLGGFDKLPTHKTLDAEIQTRTKDEKMKADDVAQVTIDFWNRVTPFIEADSGVSMTMATRTNMTFEVCGWLLGACHGLVQYQPCLSERGAVNGYVAYKEMMDQIYGGGSNQLKKLKGIIDSAVTTTPMARWCADGGGIFKTTLGGERVQYVKGVLYRDGAPQSLREVTPSQESYFRGYVLALDDLRPTDPAYSVRINERRAAKLTELKESGQHHLHAYLSKGTLSRGMAKFLYEPMAAFGYTYSYHGLVVMQTLRPSNYIDRDNPFPDHPVVEDVRQYIAEAFKKAGDLDGKEMNSIKDMLRRLTKYMTTSKSAGYSTRITLEGALASYLDHKGRGGLHKAEVQIRSSSKAMSEAFMMSRMCSAVFLRHSGTFDSPLNGGERDVTNGRLKRLMFMLHTATQIPLQKLYVMLANMSMSPFVTSAGVIDPMSYSSVRGDSTDLEKLWMIHVMSSQASLFEDYVLNSLDYSTMDQHTGLQIHTWIQELFGLGGPAVSYPLKPQDEFSRVEKCTTSAADVTSATPLGISEPMGKFCARGLYHATHAIFASPSSAPGTDGLRFSPSVTLPSGRKVKGKLPKLSKPAYCRTTFNTSGNNITALSNNAANAVVLCQDCILWGDDAVKFYRIERFAADFRRDLDRARALKQKLSGEDCALSSGATYLKNVVNGLECIKRQRTLSKERSGLSISPLSARAELTSLYEACVRSGSEAGFPFLAKFYIKASSAFKGFGYNVKMPSGWFCVGGDLPNLLGPRPFNVNPSVAARFSGNLLPWLKFLGEEPQFHEGKQSVFRPDTNFKDDRAVSFGMYLTGIKQRDPPAEFSKYTVEVREIKGKGELMRLTSTEAIARARGSFESVLDVDVLACARSALESVGNETIPQPDGSFLRLRDGAAMDYLHEMSYSSDVARQAAAVFAEAVSFASKPQAIAERMAAALEHEPVMNIEDIVELDVGMSWDDVVGVCKVNVTVVGFFRYVPTGTGEATCSYQWAGRPDEEYKVRPLFDSANGSLEKALVAFFGIDTNPDDAKMMSTILYERPSLTYLQVLRVIKICNGQMAIAANILGVSLETMAKKFSFHSLQSVRVSEALLSAGSCRMTGITGSIGYDVVRELVTITGAPSELSRIQSAANEFGLAYHSSVWLMLMNSLDGFGIGASLELPIMSITVDCSGARAD